MANKKKLIAPKQISIQIEQDDYDKLSVKVPNVTKFVREYIHDFVNTEDTLSELKRELHEKINQRDNLNIEIEILEDRIRKIEYTYKQNENNNKILSELMQEVLSVKKNEYNNQGIPEERVKAIANEKINPILLIKECEKQSIPFIKESQISNSTLTTGKKGKPKDNLEVISNSFFRQWKNQHTQRKYKTKQKFLDDNEKFSKMCETKGIEFDKFKEYVLTHDD